MDRLVAIVSRSSARRLANNDDFTSRLSHRYTVAILVMSAVLVSMHQYVGKPITCWAPVHFTGSHQRYTNAYCWVSNTYYLPYTHRIPAAGEYTDHKHQLYYYQWIPFILLGQAVFFYLPNAFWYTLNSKSGVDSDNILQSAEKLRNATNQMREQYISMITNQISRFLGHHMHHSRFYQTTPKRLAKLLCGCFRLRWGCYLTFLFLTSKMLYIGNIFFQLFALNSILGTQYYLFGWQAFHQILYAEDDLAMIISTKPAHNSTFFTRHIKYPVFPRVTMCDFIIRRLGNNHRYTVQCVLPINLYVERLYMFLWLWMIVILVLSSYSFLIWLIRSIAWADRKRYIKNQLFASGQLQEAVYGEEDIDPKIEVAVETFIRSYLLQDGVFLLRLIHHNTDKPTVSDITAALWRRWLTEEKAKHSIANGNSLPRAVTTGPSAPPLGGMNHTKPHIVKLAAPPQPRRSIDEVDMPMIDDDVDDEHGAIDNNTMFAKPAALPLDDVDS